MAVIDFAKSLLRLICQDYRINVVVAGDGAAAPLPLPDGVAVRAMTDADVAMVTQSATDKVRGAVSYARAGHAGFVLTDAGGIQCVAHFATPGNYDFASIWPLEVGEMCLVNIATEGAAFGRGYAPMLISHATHVLCQSGARRITAFIWWSNTPSRRAFTKAGWRMIGRSVEAQMFGRWWAWRWRIKP